ncbi:PREDICTED: uncharacterized protein LOC101296124 isoform X2 [Fragaria vesca subsp. vesca]|uniref:uncharacterized protein LOC101296124 isoform X2 n=1 Tax=Fragaria vesca subsp. vesca TaxID=101020 RepID=UPI0002C36DA9|nr:PREDICTED: uncharacterized protein LOC101296124 isoform X2 [Fragaria vesca subsp. vesca]
MASATPAAMSRKQKVFARLRQENEGRRVGKSNPTITVNPTDQQEGVETSEREWMDEGGRRRPLPLFMQRHREAIRKRTERQLEILNPRGPPEGLPPERLWAFTF